MKIRRDNKTLKETKDSYIPTKRNRCGEANFEVNYSVKEGMTNLSFSNFDKWFTYIYEILPWDESEELFRQALIENMVYIKEMVLDENKRYHITGRCSICCNYYGGYNTPSGIEFWIEHSKITETNLNESTKLSRNNLRKRY